MTIPEEIDATPHEIALSTLLLFSVEAKELRSEIIEANTKAILFKSPGISEEILLHQLLDSLQGTTIERHASAALSRLRGSGKIVGPRNNLKLSDSEQQLIQIANDDFLAMTNNDISVLENTLYISKIIAKELLQRAINLLIRNRELDGDGQEEESLRDFISQPKLRSKKIAIYEALSRTNSAQLKQRGIYVDHIIKTNTFDIYRSLGQRSKITMTLDASVAMPIIFGLEFGDSQSRYGIAARALRELCTSHGILIVVPSCYINEIAHHGLLALEKVTIYNGLPKEARASLKASGNAYLSHYTHINEALTKEGESLSLDDFLRHFGIINGCSRNSIENKITSMFSRHKINILQTPQHDTSLRQEIARRKNGLPEIIIDHDASMLTVLKNSHEQGFVFATWDYVMIDLVQNITRILADTPTRVIDFLSMAKGENFATEGNFEVMSSLHYIDEVKIQALAEKIDRIKNITQAYKLQAIIDEARQTHGPKWTLSPEDVAPLLDVDDRDNMTAQSDETSQ